MSIEVAGKKEKSGDGSGYLVVIFYFYVCVWFGFLHCHVFMNFSVFADCVDKSMIPFRFFLCLGKKGEDEDGWEKKEQKRSKECASHT